MSPKRRADLVEELAKLTKDQLIERLLAQSHSGPSKTVGKKRKERPFDFDAYAKQHVAMKVAYLGWPFHGYASQISFKATSEHKDMQQMSDLPTVEEHLFRALMTAKLIESPTTANYSRCGRTDAGVSATGQVIGLTIRASLKKTTDTEEQVEKELPVAVMLNSLLPPEIRVLEVVPAPEDFTARFDCKYREYHYYFPRAELNIEAMREAAAMLLGQHDFRNFCKRDPSKEVENYVRDILEARIEPVHPETGSVHDMFKFVIRGTAFLYHQVRCTMAVLFLVGRGKANADVVQYLLTNLDEEWRPTYQMASEIPLVLVECGFDRVAFSTGGHRVSDLFCNAGAELRNQRHFFGLWKDKTAQALTIQSILSLEFREFEGPAKMQIILRKP